MRLRLTFVFILFVQLNGYTQTITKDSIMPSLTDAGLGDAYNFRNYMMKSSQDTMNTLVLFLPGTYRRPNEYLFIQEELVKLGYHVIGLTYNTEPPINPVCRGTGDVTCHWRARMETIDGTPRHTSVTVDATHSILNRLQKLLQWLVTNRPTGGWGQFYSGGQIVWDKIIVTGHSQGASLSGILGKEFPVKRVVMFSVMDYLLNGDIPNWVDNTTGHEKYYAFIHPKDEQVPFTAAQIGWDKLGMSQHGAMVNIDCNVGPFNNTHILYSTYIPTTTTVDYHNGTTIDSYIKDETAYKTSLVQALKYLFKK